MAPIPNPVAPAERAEPDRGDRPSREPAKPLPRPTPSPPARPVPAPSPTPAPPPAAAPRTGADPARARRLRLAGLEQLNRGAVDRAVGLLQQAAQLDPDSALIRRDLERARRIGQAVRNRP